MDLYAIRKELSMGVSFTSMKLRVTAYSRVSTEHLEQQKSLKNQVEYFSEMIKNNKNWTYVSSYVDEGISGTTDFRRDNFMKMIDDARCGKFDLIVTKEISRFSRNTLDSIKYTRELLSYGVAVLFVNDNINTALPDSELRLTIMASMAQDEIRRLSERVKFGMNRAIKNGIILGNNMLYGYRKDKFTGKLLIVSKEASVVRRLFSLYAVSNYSLVKIAKFFNDEGILTSQNKKWCVSTLTRMIKNPKYKGYYCGKKTEIVDYMTKRVFYIPMNEWVLYEDKDRIPPIVDEELWKRANERLKKRNKKFGGDYKKSKIMYQNRYPLSALLYCDFDGYVFHRRCQCKNDITWVCSRYLCNGKDKCDSPMVRESEIYTIFDDIFMFLEIDLDDVICILLELYDSTNYGVDIELSRLERQRNKILMKKDKLLELNIEGNLSNSEFCDRNVECNKELSGLDEMIFFLEKSKHDGKNRKMEDVIKRVVKDVKINNQLIRLLFEKIVVSKINNDRENMNLKIYFNLSKSFFNDGKFILDRNCFMRSDYEFKRGYDVVGTRRYLVRYHVSSYIF